MLAPAVVVASATQVAVVNVPAAGRNVGVAAVPSVIQKLPAPLLLSLQPLRNALALTVIVAATEMALEYAVDVVVGSLPSVAVVLDRDQSATSAVRGPTSVSIDQRALPRTAECPRLRAGVVGHDVAATTGVSAGIPYVGPGLPQWSAGGRCAGATAAGQD